MIIRISGEGQFELDDSLHAELNDLDDAIVAAVESGDEQEFRRTFEALLDYVRERGTELPGDDLHGSDIIIPPADPSFEEAREEFSGEGLVPDPA